jgi:hypothetical protein
MCILLSGLFYDAFSISEYISLNIMMTGELLIGKNFKLGSAMLLPGVTEKTM